MPHPPPSEAPAQAPAVSPPSEPSFVQPAPAQTPDVSPPSEAGCSFIQPAPAQAQAPAVSSSFFIVMRQKLARPPPFSAAPPPSETVQPAPAVPATRSKKRNYQDFDDEMEVFDSWVDDDKIFDATRKFNTKIPGGPAPVDLEEDPSMFRGLTKCATLALEDYNSRMQTNYRFVDIEMATWQPANGLIYHITFQARNATEKEYSTFQASLYTNYRMMRVMDVRMKGSKWYLGNLSELY